MKKKHKTYHVSLAVMVETTLEIPAESYEQALEKARALKVKDVVDFDTSHDDSSIRVTGLFNSNEGLDT